MQQTRAGQRLEFLSLQRCFQAKDDVLSELLATAASSKQTLRCIAVSHLQLQQWATSSDLSTELNMSVQSGTVQEMEATQTVPKQLHASVRQSSQLYALALHNCQGITSAGLQAVVTACPQLQMLLLGGSNLSIPLSMTMCSIATAAAGIPMLNSIPRSRAATITTLLQRAPARRHPAARQIATELAALTQQLPQLMLLEVTFLPHGVREELKGLLENRDTDMRADTGSSNRACKVHVLDFCECSSIAAAATRHSELYQHAVDASAAAGAQRQQHFRLLLEAAANCSNAARQTPLHMAIDRKDPEAVEVSLLQNETHAMFGCAEALHCSCMRAWTLSGDGLGPCFLGMQLVCVHLYTKQVLLHSHPNTGYLPSVDMYAKHWLPGNCLAVSAQLTARQSVQYEGIAIITPNLQTNQSHMSAGSIAAGQWDQFPRQGGSHPSVCGL